MPILTHSILLYKNKTQQTADIISNRSTTITDTCEISCGSISCLLTANQKDLEVLNVCTGYTSRDEVLASLQASVETMGVIVVEVLAGCEPID